MSQFDKEIRSGIYGNVGTLIAFGVGPEDAKELAPYFELSPSQLMNQQRTYAKLKRALDVEHIKTMPPIIPATDNLNSVLALSRERFSDRTALVLDEKA
jgi:hypothetical protein